MIDRYVDTLLSSELLLPLWGAVALWAVLFAVNHWIYRESEGRRRAQSAVIAAEAGTRRGVAQLILQLVFALFVFVIASVLGEPAYTFFAGGFLVMMAMAVGFNLHSMLFATALAAPAATEGSVKLSAAIVLRIKAAQIFGAGVGCLCMMLIVPHLTLGGASLFLISTAIGFHRRANKVAAA